MFPPDQKWFGGFFLSVKELSAFKFSMTFSLYIERGKMSRKLLIIGSDFGTLLGQLAVGGPEKRDLLRGDGALALADGFGHGEHLGVGIVGGMGGEHPGGEEDQRKVHIASPPVTMGISVVPAAGEMEMILSTTYRCMPRQGSVPLYSL